MAPIWLKSLPWSTLLSNAPLLVDGAKKLVSLVKNKPAPEVPRQAADAFSNDPASELGALHLRLLQLEAEQRQTAELLRAMAESQSETAQVLDALRARARLTLRVAVISFASVAILLIWTFTR
jgi:hypothetical protein